MKPLISIIIPYRNRETERIRRCLDSLENQTSKEFEVVFLDYGSDYNYVEKIKPLVDGYSFVNYVYNNTKGWFWNRSHCLNSGIKIANSEFIMTTDADMIFESHFVETAIKYLDKNTAIFSECYYAPKGIVDLDELNNNLHKCDASGKVQFGGCQILSKEKLEEVGGFDEYFRIWGVEDIDIHSRLMKTGIDICWIPIDEVKIFHQWHPIVSSSNKVLMPSNWYEKMWSYYENNKKLKRNNEWGKIYTEDERPVLKDENSTEFVFQYPKTSSYLNFIRTYRELNSGDRIDVKFKEKYIRSENPGLKTKLISFTNKLLDIFIGSHNLINKSIASPDYINTSEIRDFLFYFIIENETNIDYTFSIEEYSVLVSIHKIY